MQWNTFIGSAGFERCEDTAVDKTRNVFLTGPGGMNWGTPVNPHPGDVWDALVAKISSTIEVDIDIKPGSFPNSINARSLGVIPVSILTTNEFDASTVDPSTAFFGATGTEAPALRAALADINGDG